jgi:hypothetical protein
MQETYVHDFHCVLDRGTKERLMDLEVFKESRGLSGAIVNILKVLSPVVKDEHTWGEERMGRYMPVCEDADEIREDVHVYMPGEMYRELKLLHQDLNVYSIAQLVRGFIGWFFEFVDGCEGDPFMELEKMFSRWEKEEEETRLTPREYLRQLFTILRHLPGKNRLVNIYDRKFSPFWILRM